MDVIGLDATVVKGSHGGCQTLAIEETTLVLSARRVRLRLMRLAVWREEATRLRFGV